MRYLRALWAELYREYIEIRRYPFEIIASSLIFAFIFIVTYMMARGLISGVGIDLANKQIQHNVANMFIGYIVWMFAFFIMASIPGSITRDVSSGLLEQTFLSPLPAGILILFRAVGQTVASILPIIITGIFMALVIETNFIFDPIAILICLFFLSIGSIGIGLFSGGIFLIYKRASMLNAIIVWSTALLVTADYSVSGFWGILMRLFPTSQGIRLFRSSMVEGVSLEQMISSYEIIYLMAGSVGFLILGIFAFNFFDKIARRHGLIGQY